MLRLSIAAYSIRKGVAAVFRSATGRNPESSADDDPRNEPAPFLFTVGAMTVTAAAIVLFYALTTEPGPTTSRIPPLIIIGPLVWVGYEMVTTLWWKRWWALAPAAVAGLGVFFLLRSLITASFATSVACVAGWAAFAVVFALGSRLPRTPSPER
ncbi:hypothetical protein [Microbispora sp. NPDC046933]|uniref:hypothetical protein n=1 Tax=Microbispora sp. NPDC046933 TaxID=3155618 RepID=UPI0033EB5111